MNKQIFKDVLSNDSIEESSHEEIFNYLKNNQDY